MKTAVVLAQRVSAVASFTEKRRAPRRGRVVGQLSFGYFSLLPKKSNSALTKELETIARSNKGRNPTTSPQKTLTHKKSPLNE